MGTLKNSKDSNIAEQGIPAGSALFAKIQTNLQGQTFQCGLENTSN